MGWSRIAVIQPLTVPPKRPAAKFLWPPAPRKLPRARAAPEGLEERGGLRPKGIEHY